MSKQNTQSKTPRTDAAEKARKDYFSAKSSEDLEAMCGMSQEAQAEWIKNCPPNGWSIAHQLETEPDEAKAREQMKHAEMERHVITIQELRQQLAAAQAEIVELRKQVEADKYNREMWANIIVKWSELCLENEELKKDKERLDWRADMFESVINRPHQYRVGQAAFNWLHRSYPSIAFEIKGTLLDPFYKDTLPEDFLHAIDAAIAKGNKPE